MEHPDTTAPAPPEGGGTVLHFHDGIPGLAGGARYALSDLTKDGTFQLLACVDDPALSLVVTSPWLFFPDYTPDVPEADRLGLHLEGPEDALVFCSVIAEDTDDLFLNLRAPFVANRHSLTARQVILDDEDLPLRASVTSTTAGS